MPDRHYEDPALAALYDDDSGWSQDRDFYLELAGSRPIRILDLGCGTGLLADAYASRGHQVTGVDPARAMLDLAAQKPNGGRIVWVEATAQDFRSDSLFDLIVMTGNAFQVLLDEVAIAACLATMRQHLAPGGTIGFESRNPALDWVALFGVDMPQSTGQPGRSRRVLRRTGQTIEFQSIYSTPGGVKTSHSVLRFASRETVERLATAAGLRVEAVYGDWARQPFDPAQSAEMVFILRLT